MNSVLMQPRLLADGNAGDHDIFNRYILVHTAAASFYRFDLLDHVHAFCHFGKYAVTPTLGVFSTEVQEVVIHHVDEELCGGRVWIVGTSHCQGATVFFRPLLASFLMVALVSF